ncbi:hypothetical protein [Streptomyces sp. H27-D2]|uniref:hypothetical protein n=1 Tax=Streptomyces sp. H27-D2 TaxID=3046304 RepID=UPI002DB72274|nr:hypothetical protein [Streptomyces sp. H27-D2]MEC4016132.1 hypothetical protein [Streptomyces sp. H27-D2]
MLSCTHCGTTTTNVRLISTVETANGPGGAVAACSRHQDLYPMPPSDVELIDSIQRGLDAERARRA